MHGPTGIFCQAYLTQPRHPRGAGDGIQAQEMLGTPSLGLLRHLAAYTKLAGAPNSKLLTLHGVLYGESL